MISYSISYQNTLNQLVDIEMEINQVNQAFLEFQLPAWRPGRYEFQNFAANIKTISAFGKNNELLPLDKVSRNKWKASTQDHSIVKLRYQYYASQMDAGGCWLDETQLYLNFICCAFYIPERINEKCQVTLNLPEDYRIACGLPKMGNVLNADNFYHLADSPFIASATLSHLTYQVKGIDFHIWIQGKNHLDQNKLISDFTKFTEVQIEQMGDFPEKDFHFLFQFLPYTHYHGVEHRNSTVITLGTAEDIPGKRYEDLLGISSHELFHAWNIIKIRPKEMLPYDFTKENYFQTGFVAEGFTTYYGDLFLARAGVFSTEEYLKEINTTLGRHFNHFGNTNLSLADSSFDLWVDGYSQGIPNRKVSIYVKGCVVALLFDLKIRQATNHEKSLDDVLLVLWNDFGKKEIGYTVEDILNIMEAIADCSLKDFFKECVFEKTDLRDLLETLLPTIGCSLTTQASPSIAESHYGFSYTITNEKIIVHNIAPNSPAEKSLCKGDQLVVALEKADAINIEAFLLANESFTIEVVRYGRKVPVILNRSSTTRFYDTYTITPLEGDIKNEMIKKWL